MPCELITDGSLPAVGCSQRCGLERQPLNSPAGYLYQGGQYLLICHPLKILTVISEATL